MALYNAKDFEEFRSLFYWHRSVFIARNIENLLLGFETISCVGHYRIKSFCAEYFDLQAQSLVR